MSACLLTTIDNPYDPYDDFGQWYLFDMTKGYNTCALLDRIARTSSQLSEFENDLVIERAIDEVIKYDFQNIYKKIKKNDEPDDDGRSSDPLN